MKKNTVLLVEENLWDAGLVQEALAEIGETNHLRVSSREYQIVHVQSMEGALEVLTEIPVEIILLDLNLPDSKALHSFFQIHSRAPGIPLVILCGREDESLAVSAMREGAQDYLIKDEIDCIPLARCLNYAIERQQSKAAYAPATPTDELTGLYSCQTFGLLANHSLRLAARLQLAILVAVADLGLEGEGGDSFARQAQDMALLSAADVLRAKFDASAVVSRVSSLRFAVVALFADSGSAAVMSEHLSAAAELYNQSPVRQARLSMRLGMKIMAAADLCDDEATIEPLLALAAASISSEQNHVLATA
jgi:two-component system cell cycle response regulator